MAKKTPLKSKTIVQRMQGIVFKEVEGVVYILDYQTVTLRTLNETAGFVWKQLSRPKTVQQLQTALLENFSAGEKTVEKDLEKFLREYQKLGFLKLKS